MDTLLIATISPVPRIKLIRWPVAQVWIDGENFAETGAGDTNGFYDFLRLANTQMVGVRFTPFVKGSNICDSATSGPGLKLAGSYPFASLELFWGTERGYDSALSADQFMDWNYIFQSSSGRYAVTFGFSHLSNGEIKDLRAAVERSSA